jgi:hypothetical protein
MSTETQSMLAPHEVNDTVINPRDLRQLYREEMARALDLISLDSGLNPHRYLHETLVPHGGE